jgi:endonuclease/exonuclease/phosphatase family metal-dependent hydrolase
MSERDLIQSMNQLAANLFEMLFAVRRLTEEVGVLNSHLDVLEKTRQEEMAALTGENKDARPQENPATT